MNPSAFSVVNTNHKFIRYVLAVSIALAALLLRSLLTPLLGITNPYHTAWIAIVFSAWYCGIGPSIVAVAITSFGIWYWFLPPRGSFVVESSNEIFGMAGFLAFSAVIVYLGERTRRIAAEHERAEAELREAHERAEERVRARTAALEERTTVLQQRTADLIEKALLLDLANDAIFVKGANGTITYWNEGATRLYGWTSEEALGKVPAELLQSVYPIPLAEIEGRQDWEGEIYHTTRDGDHIIVASRWAKIQDSHGNFAGWLEINTDITSRKQAENSARALSGRILSLQDEERRRIARGLHDSLGQYLAALKMNLEGFSGATSEQSALLSECLEILEKCISETRTVSYLLHPPLLDEAGFGSAARWYVEGFARRSGITVNLDLPPELIRLPPDVELALFRAVQESLTNIHKHSGSSLVNIRVIQDDKQVRLEIEDNGHGIPKERLRRLLDGRAEVGVGIPGMRERSRELGGSLEIRSNGNGTTVLVKMPIPQRATADSTGNEDPERSISAA